MKFFWCRSLFFKILMWLWLTILFAMILAGMTLNWLEDDFIRPATSDETMQVLQLLDRLPPLPAEGHKLWGQLQHGWNLVVVPVDAVSELPHDIEEFVDQAGEVGRIMYGQDDGWLMIGPVQQGGFLYTAVARQGFQQALESDSRWVVPLVLIVAVTALCFLLVWSLTSPMRRLQAAVRHMADGDFDVSELNEDLKRQDELGQLVREVARMANATHRLLASQQQLIQDVSHELRSPLARVQIALGLARKKDAEGKVDRELDRIERASGQVAELIEQILDLARLDRLEDNQLQTQCRVLYPVLQQWLEDAELELAGRRLTARVELADPNLRCQWDWMLVERAFDNLLRNAIRYSPEGSEICIGVAISDDQEVVELAVCDQGPGVPEDMLETIFDPFRQVDSARSPGASGVGYGIGLALVSRIAELHQGQVVAANTTPGLRVSLRLAARCGD